MHIVSISFSKFSTDYKVLIRGSPETRQTLSTRGKRVQCMHGYRYSTLYPYPQDPFTENRGVTRTCAVPYCHVSEMSGTDSVRHVRHIRCPRPMSENPCLKSGMFLSGSDIIIWHLSGHSLFSPLQTAARYTTDTLQVLLILFSRPQIMADIAIQTS